MKVEITIGGQSRLGVYRIELSQYIYKLEFDFKFNVRNSTRDRLSFILLVRAEFKMKIKLLELTRLNLCLISNKKDRYLYLV